MRSQGRSGVGVENRRLVEHIQGIQDHAQSVLQIVAQVQDILQGKGRSHAAIGTAAMVDGHRMIGMGGVEGAEQHIGAGQSGQGKIGLGIALSVGQQDILSGVVAA